jgi:predicted PurR-regulated permease PerM
VRDAAALALVLAGLGFALELLQAVLPILIGFLGAYLVAPLVRWFEVRGIRRGWVVLVTSLLTTAGVIGAGVFLIPRLVRELARLRDRIPKYLGVIQAELGVDAGDLLDALDVGSALDALERVEPLLGVVGSVVGTTASWLLFVVLLLVAFTVFNLEFERLPLLMRYVPRSRRQQLEPAAEVVVDVFRGYLRGQLLVMLFTGTVYVVGFQVLDVPFGVFAGLVGGLLSIIPYGQLAGPLLAVLFNVLESQVTGALDPLWSVGLPLVVYGIMQALESFVVTPLVQGAVTRLHPLAILACLAAGGSIGGILGVFLAIPVTAAGWILAKERLFPAWRAWAERN